VIKTPAEAIGLSDHAHAVRTARTGFTGIDRLTLSLTEPHRVSRRPVGLSQTGMV
jgi:hypothetical protein